MSGHPWKEQGNEGEKKGSLSGNLRKNLGMMLAQQIEWKGIDQKPTKCWRDLIAKRERNKQKPV